MSNEGTSRDCPLPSKVGRVRGKWRGGQSGEQIKHAAETRRGPAAEVRVRMLPSHELSVREREELDSADIMTDFIMHVDKPRCASGSPKLSWYKVLFV